MRESHGGGQDVGPSVDLMTGLFQSASADGQ